MTIISRFMPGIDTYFVKENDFLVGYHSYHSIKIYFSSSRLGQCFLVV